MMEKSIVSETRLSTLNYKVNDNEFVVWKAKHNEDAEYAYQSKVKISRWIHYGRRSRNH